MDNFPITSNNYRDPNSWKAIWNRPGGTFAKITAVAAACGIGYGFVMALPFLISAAANTLIFIGELVAIFGIIMVLSSKSFWKWISLFWTQLNRRIVGMFVRIDPISILKNGIQRMKEQLQEVENNITKLGGVLEQMKKDLRSYEDEFKTNVRRREASQKRMSSPNITPEEMMSLKGNYVVINNDITRLTKIIANQQKRIEISERYLNVLKRLKILANFKCKDAESELHWRAQEYEQAKKQQKAMKSIKNIFSGGLGKTMEEEMALEFCAETVNNSIAEMQSLLDGSSDLLINMDLDSMANIDNVDEILAKFEKDGFASFNEDGSSQMTSITVDQPYQPVGQQALPNGVETISASQLASQTAEPVKVKSKYF